LTLHSIQIRCSSSFVIEKDSDFTVVISNIIVIELLCN
jgi:hypothetical protein